MIDDKKELDGIYFKCSSFEGMNVIESIDADRHHVSFSRTDRLPTWDEVKLVRDKFCDPSYCTRGDPVVQGGEEARPPFKVFAHIY